MNKLSYKVNPDVLSEYIDEDLVLVNTNTNEILELNETASLLWDSILQDKSIAEIRNHFLLKYDITQEALDIEIEKTLRELLSEKMIILTSGAHSQL